METKKMTLKEAQNYVRNTKYIVWNEYESRKLQDKLFEIGCEWATGKVVINTEYPFLFVDDKMKISFAPKEACKIFDESERFSLLVDDVLCIEIEQEKPKPKFDPNTLEVYDKVLVRENQKQVWKAKFFHCKKGGQFYMIDDSMYNFCIPFNDETKHLHGTREEEPDFYKQN